jgi:hypothetical protein
MVLMTLWRGLSLLQRRQANRVTSQSFCGSLEISMDILGIAGARQQNEIDETIQRGRHRTTAKSSSI